MTRSGRGKALVVALAVASAAAGFFGGQWNARRTTTSLHERCAQTIGPALNQDARWLATSSDDSVRSATTDMMNRIDTDEIGLCVPQLADRRCKRSDTACLRELALAGADALGWSPDVTNVK